MGVGGMRQAEFVLAVFLRASGLPVVAVTMAKILHISQTVNEWFGLMF